MRELILESEFGVAQSVLREQSVLLSLGKGGSSEDNGDENMTEKEGHLLQELWDLTQVREPPPTIEKVFKGCYKSVEESRQTLSKDVQEALTAETIPANRLVQLLKMGLEYEESMKNGGFKVKQSSKHDAMFQ